MQYDRSCTDEEEYEGQNKLVWESIATSMEGAASSKLEKLPVRWKRVDR